MEKFALLDFLKVFQSLTANGNGAQSEEKSVQNGQNAQVAPQQPPAKQAPPAPSEVYENNVMANVIARHEEIANRIRNKK